MRTKIVCPVHGHLQVATVVGDVIVVGAGGCGRETIDILRAAVQDGANWQLRGVVDDSPSTTNLELLSKAEVEYLGPCSSLTRHRSALVVMGIGSGQTRRSLTRLLEAEQLRSVAVIHPAATVASLSVIGAGSVIYAGARVMTNVRIGQHAHVDNNVTIGHDSRLDDFVSLYPQASVSGNVHLAEAVTIGTNAAVLPGLSCGPDSVIGAGAVVVRDVSEGMIVKGVPAR